MRFSFPLMFAVALWSVVELAAEKQEYPRSELLMEPTELAKPELAGQILVLDVRPQETYRQGHVPGARRIDHDAWKGAWSDGRDAQGWGKRLGELGIRPDSKVVVYDDNGMKDAARIWWILTYWGVEDARLLHGVWKGWKSAGLPTTDATPAPATPVAFTPTRRSHRLATKDQILELLRGDKLQIVDARSEDEFCGIDKKDNKRGGAIPDAKHLEWSDLIDQETQRFKSPKELRGLFGQAGIDLDRPMASHCQSGGRASVMAFGLELMGAKEARNYYRGWSEWGNSDDTPIVVPERAK